MSESAPERYDVLGYPDGMNRAVPAGDGQRIVEAHVRESQKRELIASAAAGFIAVVVVVLGALWVLDGLVVSLGVGLALGVVAGVLRAQYWHHDDFVPDLVVSDASPRIVRDHVDDFDPADVPESVT